MIQDQYKEGYSNGFDDGLDFVKHRVEQIIADIRPNWAEREERIAFEKSLPDDRRQDWIIEMLELESSAEANVILRLEADVL